MSRTSKRFSNKLYKHSCVKKYFFGAFLFAGFLVPAMTNSSVKPTESNEAKKAAMCNVNTYNSFYTGPNCKKLEQQLADIKQEILEEIRALKRNESNGQGGKGGL